MRLCSWSLNLRQVRSHLVWLDTILFLSHVDSVLLIPCAPMTLMFRYVGSQEFRKRLRKYAHLASTLEGARSFEAREHLHGICQAFVRFLGDATDFYSSLLRRFEAMHHQYAKGTGNTDGRGSGNVAEGDRSESEQRRSRLLRLTVLSINRCLIFLGDLARYRELHGENSPKDWSSAERYYHQVGLRHAGAAMFSHKVSKGWNG